MITRNNIIQLSVIMFFVLCGCSRTTQNVEHFGEKKISLNIIDLDTIVIDDDYLSGMYNAFQIDSCIVYTDQLQHTLNFYNLNDGSLNSRRLGYGNGPKELPSILYAQPIRNSNNEIIIVDSSNGVFIYHPGIDSLEFKGRIDFNWLKGHSNNYNESSNYNLMEMSDFSISFVKRDSSIIIPLSIINRNFDKIDGKRYSSGHIFCNVDYKTMVGSEPFGKFPDIYKSHPMPYFEFFDFTTNEKNGNIIYSFAPDSLIYIADANGEPIKSIGFEPSGINREYTIGFDVDGEIFKKDKERVGVNTGLYFDDEMDLIFRTAMRNFNSGEIVLQVYNIKGDLLLEEEMPRYFKMLGKYNGYYYGVRFISVEDQPDGDNEKMSYPFYRFRIQ